MVAQAATTGDVLSGCLTMAVFGLGTFPAMLAMGGIGRLLAPGWRQRGVRLAGSFILALGLVTLGRGVRADGGRPWLAPPLASRMTAAPGSAVPTTACCRSGGAGFARTVNGEGCQFCCYGCCIAHQVKSGSGDASEAAWLLVRLGVGSFLSMNIMLFSLLVYSGAFSGADRRVLPTIHLLLWGLATPAVLILGEPFLRETWSQAGTGA